MDVTLDALKHSTPHPMAREIRFQTILLGLKVLKTSTTIGAIAQWRLKELLLSAGLSWFNSAPRWSFGSNILQLRTEIRLLSDVMMALKPTAQIGAQAVGSIRSLVSKEKLFQLLLENEQSRLIVWAHPMSEPPRTQLPSSAVHINKSTLEVYALPRRESWYGC
jgi:phosphatidylinositol 4-kinase